MGFNRGEVDLLLTKCHRRCCICHRFCGVKIETDHMTPKGQGGSDNIDNAIALCFECHAEVHLYNDKHPRGRKYLGNELKMHKEQWLRLCELSPQILVERLELTDGGPLAGLISELEFNSLLTGFIVEFETKEFSHSVSNGALSILDDSVKNEIMSTYVVIRVVNDTIRKYYEKKKEPPIQWVLNNETSGVKRDIDIAKEAINSTLQLLSRYVRN